MTSDKGKLIPIEALLDYLQVSRVGLRQTVSPHDERRLGQISYCSEVIKFLECWQRAFPAAPEEILPEIEEKSHLQDIRPCYRSVVRLSNDEKLVVVEDFDSILIAYEHVDGSSSGICSLEAEGVKIYTDSYPPALVGGLRS